MEITNKEQYLSVVDADASITCPRLTVSLHVGDEEHIGVTATHNFSGDTVCLRIAGVDFFFPSQEAAEAFGTAVVCAILGSTDLSGETHAK